MAGPSGRGYRAPRCVGCGLRSVLCICSELPQFEARTQVHLTLHHLELRKPSGTARLLRRLLPNHEQSVYGARTDTTEPSPVDSAVNGEPVIDANSGVPKHWNDVNPDERRVLVLYPDLNAPLLSTLCSKITTPVRLVVPDGTWPQTRRWRRRQVHDITQLVRLDTIETRYQLRRSSDPANLCTFEAVAHALRYLESEELTRNLLHWFEVWKSRALASRAGGIREEDT